jgi:DNA-binding MarR family transcriptional regulator
MVAFARLSADAIPALEMKEPMAKRSLSDVARIVRESETSMATLYDDIEAAWLQQRPDLDMAMACTLLRLERVNQLHEIRVQALSKSVGLQTGELHVLLALRRSGKPYELRPTDLFRALLVTSGAMTKRVARLQEGGFILRVSANDDGRSELVRLTAKGLATADRAITEIARAVERVTGQSGLTRAEIVALDRALRKLLTVTTVKAGTPRKRPAK